MKKSVLYLFLLFVAYGLNFLAADNARVDFSTHHQMIRGFGGVNMPSWIDDLRPDEVEKAFGTGEGQIGLSILRIKVPYSRNQWEREIETARLAKDKGAMLFATPWSPPAELKSNGNIVGGELLPENYDAFATHLRDFCNYMEQNGAPLYAVSVQNEPDYRVDYESCDWSSDQLIHFLENHASSIPAKIIAPESFQFRRELSDPILRDPEAAAEVDIVGGHIYGGGLFSYPLAKKKRKEIWMTEHLNLETDWENNLGTGKEIHDCLLRGFNAYIWWYIRRYYGPIDEEGFVSKRGFVMSHFSRFIRPGMVRVEADPNPAYAVSLSAFRGEKHTALVAVNQSSEAVTITLEFSGGDLAELNRWQTTEHENVVAQPPVFVLENQVSVTLPAESITTFTGDIIPKPMYSNPVLPGDHPDLTLLRHEDDFYLSGSSFHRTPYGTIWHSRDLVHWETISNVIPSSWSELISDAPGNGVWQGAITYFYDSFWFYFSNTAGGGQYFCRAEKPEGPWSDPIKMNSTLNTGATGYDNSVFVDDDGTPYLLIKAGRNINRIQPIGRDGHLVGDVINLDWMNAGNRFRWAEGPVMCKRNGYYYYFIAGDVSGGQWVFRSQTLSDKEVNWEFLGEFFEPISDPLTGFRGPNHITAPVQLDDDTWWCMSHSYELNSEDDWRGRGRQGLLHQIHWDEQGRPTASAPTAASVNAPHLLNAEIVEKLPVSDEFEENTLAPDWYTLGQNESQINLEEVPGCLKLIPGESGRAHLLQRESEHSYTLITKVNPSFSVEGQRAGIYLSNGNESQVIELYLGFRNGSSVFGLQVMGNSHEIAAVVEDSVWLKIERIGHLLSAFYSRDGEVWVLLIENIDATLFDAEQANFNSWIGNSHGLFVEGGAAAFDRFLYNEDSAMASIWLEAECGEVGALWRIEEDLNASGNQYVTIADGFNSPDNASDEVEGMIHYTFDVDNAGNYQFWGRFICPTAADDSLWFRIDNGAWTMWNGIAPQSSNWTWDKSPQPFMLRDGPHILTVAYREDGAFFDKWCFTQSDNEPETVGGLANNCVR